MLVLQSRRCSVLFEVLTCRAFLSTLFCLFDIAVTQVMIYNSIVLKSTGRKLYLFAALCRQIVVQWLKCSVGTETALRNRTLQVGVGWLCCATVLQKFACDVCWVRTLEKKLWPVSLGHPLQPTCCHHHVDKFPQSFKLNDVISSESLLLCLHYAWYFCIPIMLFLMPA